MRYVANEQEIAMFSRRLLILPRCFIGFFTSQLSLAQPRNAAAGFPQRSIDAPSVDGVWLGTLHAGEQTLNLRLPIKADSSGEQVYTLYSPDQGAKPIPCTNVKLNANGLSFDIPPRRGTLERWSVG
jgi:hypothetical protein